VRPGAEYSADPISVVVELEEVPTMEPGNEHGRDDEGTQTRQAHDRARRSRDDAAGRHDWQGKRREGRGRRQAGLAYIRSLPQPQRAIAERVDALAAKTLPGLQRSVKWGMAFHGVGDGWCFSCGGFAGHVKLTFGHGTALKPVPPVSPIEMGKSARGVDLESVDELDERQAASWMEQVTAIPGFGGKKR
jgi:hypothetical protein